MSLKYNEPNALSTLGLRKLSFVPMHFKSCIITNFNDIQILDQWISYNLNSRYAIKKSYTINDNNLIVEGIEIGFEDPSEITFFMLGCPYIRK
jgi:hypothetical protein